jgi:hypothetical protein
MRLERRDGFITLSSSLQRQGGRGFSLLIKEAGFYTLRKKVWGRGKPASDNRPDLCIRAGVSESNQSSGSVVFRAEFPLVFREHREGDRIIRGGHKRRFSDILDGKVRSRYTDIITVFDAEGPAAFICLGRGGELLVIRREDAPAAAKAAETSLFEVFWK